MTPSNNIAGSVGLACAAAFISASAQASTYRFGAEQDRVVSDEPHGYTQHITPDFEVQDGIAVTYVRLGRARVARLVATDYAAKVYTDVAPLDGADGKITAGDAWISQQAQNGALSLGVTPTAVDRLLLSGARRILYESVPTTVYFAHDQLGSMTVETDDQGAVVGRRAYSTFGAERTSSGDSDSYGFAGQRQDDGGTLHFSFRQLDPTTGRWSSTDPLFQVATSANLDAFGEATTSYAYVANNPANGIDPTGLAREPRVFKSRYARYRRTFHEGSSWSHYRPDQQEHRQRQQHQLDLPANGTWTEQEREQFHQQQQAYHPATELNAFVATIRQFDRWFAPHAAADPTPETHAQWRQYRQLAADAARNVLNNPMRPRDPSNAIEAANVQARMRKVEHMYRRRFDPNY